MQEGVINFAIYEDGVEYLGVAEISLPDISRITAEIQGTGMNGTLNSPIIGNFEAMTTTFNFKTPSPEQSSLFEGRVHTLDCRAAIQERDPVTGEINVIPYKYILKVTPVKQSLGKLAPSSTSDGSGEYATSYIAHYIDGKKVTEIDILNFICIINGNDELAKVRKALGK